MPIWYRTLIWVYHIYKNILFYTSLQNGRTIGPWLNYIMCDYNESTIICRYLFSWNSWLIKTTKFNIQWNTTFPLICWKLMILPQVTDIFYNMILYLVNQRWKFSSDQLIYSFFFNKIFGNKMFQTWSLQVENEGMWVLLYRGFPLFFFIRKHFLEFLLWITFTDLQCNILDTTSENNNLLLFKLPVCFAVHFKIY